MTAKEEININTSTAKKFLNETGMRSSQGAVKLLQKKLRECGKEVAEKVAKKARDRGVKTIDEEDFFE